MYGDKGEVVGPATGEKTKGIGLAVQFPGNKSPVNCFLTHLSRAAPEPAADDDEEGGPRRRQAAANEAAKEKWHAARAVAAAKAAAKAAPRDLRATKAAAATGGGQRQRRRHSDSEEDNDMMTISHIKARKTATGWEYEVCDSISSEWSIKKPSDMVNVLYKFTMLNAARKTPGKSVKVQTGCGADDIAAKEESDDDDADAGGGSGRSSAMEEAGACTHPVGACPSSSAGAQLGLLNAAAATARLGGASSDDGGSDDRAVGRGVRRQWRKPVRVPTQWGHARLVPPARNSARSTQRTPPQGARRAEPIDLDHELGVLDRTR